MFRISELFGTFSELGTRNFKIASELLSERSEVPKVYCPLSELSELSEPDKVPKVPKVPMLENKPSETSELSELYQVPKVPRVPVIEYKVTARNGDGYQFRG